MENKFTCEGYKCTIEMSIDEAISLCEKFLEENPKGHTQLDTYARLLAIQIVLDEAKKHQGYCPTCGRKRTK